MAPLKKQQVTWGISRKAAERAKETAMPYLVKAETFVEEKFEQVKEASDPMIEKAEVFSGSEGGC